MLWGTVKHESCNWTFLQSEEVPAWESVHLRKVKIMQYLFAMETMTFCECLSMRGVHLCTFNMNYFS